MANEIERKFLIVKPTSETLSEAGAESSEIEQTYLVPSVEFPTRRVRKRVSRGTARYTYTAKRQANGTFTRIECEREIGEGEYRELLKEADPNLRTVRKTRYCISQEDGHVLEIDVFDFWENYAVLEIELGAEDESYVIPDYIKTVSEVTFDSRFLNVSLARSVPNIDDEF